MTNEEKIDLKNKLISTKSKGELINMCIRYEDNWKKLKDFISRNCFYDNDTITYEEIMNEIYKLEDVYYEI